MTVLLVLLAGVAGYLLCRHRRAWERCAVLWRIRHSCDRVDEHRRFAHLHCSSCCWERSRRCAAGEHDWTPYEPAHCQACGTHAVA